LGFFVSRVFDNHSIYALVVGGVSMIIAGLLNFIVNDKDDKKESLQDSLGSFASHEITT
jgi:maltose/moltooligosaccharide transporter